MRAAKRVASRVSDVTAGRKSERSGSRPRQRACVRPSCHSAIGKRRDRREPGEVSARIAVQARAERLFREQIRATVHIVSGTMYIRDGPTLPYFRGKWQTPAPIAGI